MSYTLLNCLLFCLMTSLTWADAPVEQIEYSGRLISHPRGAESIVVKEFSATCTLRPSADEHVSGFVKVSEPGRSLPWVEQYQRATSTASLAASQTALLYEHAGRNYVLSVSLPFFAEHQKLSADASWETDGVRYQVLGDELVNGVACWKVQFQTRPFRTQTLLVQKQSPLIVAGRQIVFMGQGDKFEIEFSSNKPTILSDDISEKLLQIENHLVAVQEELNRAANDRPAPLTTSQVTIAQQHSPALTTLATGTPLESFVKSITEDINKSSQRKLRVSDLAMKFKGQSAPKLTLQQLDGTSVPEDAFQGNVIVLHFWSYQDAPLEQPYGQIGYLDFLQNRWAEHGVKVYGVAVNTEVTNPETRGAGIRSIKKLQQFMKLGYALTYDAGGMLNAFGNPTRLGEELPLWVVLDKDQTVALYHTGYFTIDNQRGLKELDELIEQLIQ